MPMNPDNTYGNSYQELKPYMLYGDRSAAGRPLERKDLIVQDLEYLQGMYPGHMKRLQEYVVSACDHLDYKNSPMYDEYPDRMMINQICDSICDQIHRDGILADEMTAETEGAEQSNVEGTETPDWEAEETDESDLLIQGRGSTWDPPPWGPPGRRGPWGPPDSKGPWGPPGRREPWGPHGPKGPWGPPGRRGPWDAPWGPPGRRGPWDPPCCPPGQKGPWGPWGPRYNDGWLNGVVNVLLLNEMHRRRCRSGHCK